MALAQQNRLPEALTLFDQALRLKPDFGEMHHNRGVVLHQLGRLEEALASYDRALLHRPDEAGTHYNRGNALLQLARLGEAAASYDQALKLTPNNVEALLNRGYALMHLGKPEQAIADFEKVVRLKPGLADAHYNRGMALAKLGRPEDAIVSYDAALQLKPGHAGACNERGSTLVALGRPDEALESFEKAQQLKPDFAEAFYNRGVTLVRLKRAQEAVANFAKAAQLKPDNQAALSLKAHCQAAICDWSEREVDAELLQRGARLPDGADPWLAMAFDDHHARQFERARAWAQKRYVAAAPIAVRAAVRPEKLRLGYFSANVQDHPAMHAMVGLLERHDRRRFEVHLFSYGEEVGDEMRRRAVAAVDRFHDVKGLSDAAIVALARETEIDIAIDLMGYTGDCRLEIFAGRAAPIQVNYIFPGTLGAGFMDYILADRWVLPEDDRRFYSEKVYYLEHSYMATDDRRDDSGRAFTKAELGLPEQGIVFCCFNNCYKISPAEFDIWMRLLAKTEGSVLWLRLDDKTAKANLAREAEARGISRDRLVYAGRVPRPDHLARHRCADIFLDTFNYNAHTTAVDALRTGLPVISKSGRSFAARASGSLLQAIRMPELLTQSEEAYERLALDLATDPDRLAVVKAKLAANRLTTPLFDTEGTTRKFENAYDALFELALRAR